MRISDIVITNKMRNIAKINSQYTPLKIKMKHALSTLYFCLFFVTASLGQNTRFSVDLSGGIPITFASIPSSISTFGGIGIRYSVTKDISVQGLLYSGSFTGRQQASFNFIAPDAVVNYRSFDNGFFYYSLNAQLNLDRFLGLRTFLKQTNPFLVAGAGRVQSDVMAYRNVDNNKSYNFNFYSSYAGLAIRHYINPQLDFLVTCHYNFTQTYYLDGIWSDLKYDAFLLTGVGVNYKIAAKAQRQHIEWNNVILKNRIYIPDIEKRNGQPIDEEGNYVVYSKDSVSKLISINQALQEQNLAQKEEINKLQKGIDSLSKDLNSMKGKFDTLSKEMEFLKQQNQQILDKLINMPVIPQSQQSPSQSNTSAKREESKDNPSKSRATAPTVPAMVTPVRVESSVASKDEAKKSETGTQVKQNPVAQKNDDKSIQSKTDEKTNETSNATSGSNNAGAGLNSINDISAPLEKYNVVVGAYTAQKYAFSFRDNIRSKGYEAAIFRSNPNSKMLRVCVSSTPDKREALRMLRKARTEIDSKSWIHIYIK